MTDIYRDPTDGATARRVDLLRRRRDELVTMPHAIRRVVVARGARIAAAWAMALVGALLVGSAASPRIAKLVGLVLPPDDPAVIATSLLAAWLGGALVYAVARAVCEHRFTIAMTRCVLPGDDLHHDLERLAHEQPDEVARRMAHRLEVRSAVLPVMAAALLGPATLAYLALAAKLRGWPLNRVIEDTLGGHAAFLVAGGLAGLIATLGVLTPRLRSPAAAVPAAVVAITALVLAIALRGTPASWLALSVIATAGMIAMVARTLRVERAWIDTDDAAAGTEVFDAIAARLAQLRRFVAMHRAQVALVLAAFGLGLAGHASRAQLPPQRPTHLFASAFARATFTPRPPVTVDNRGAPHTGIRIMRNEYGMILYDLSLVPGDDDVYTDIQIPPGWDARIEAHVDPEHTTATDYEIEGIGDITPSHAFDVTMTTLCTTDAPRTIVLRTHARASGQVRLVVQPTLRASKC
jgi:hypothetical protein